jgi:predicted phage terminase large subunit-like protein
MTAPAPAIIYVPKLLAHQQEVKNDKRRFKVWRAGRRVGKTRGAFNCAVIGHGPRRADGRRLYPGIGHGLDVTWLAPDFPQSQTIWLEEIVPRFMGVPGVEINHQDRTATLPRSMGGGVLEIRSDKNVDGIKGKGKRLGGIIIDESKDIDLEYAWRRVIRPVLLDNGGWAIIVGTTHLGSYFNQICEDIRDEKRSAKWWAMFHHRTRDFAPFPAQDIADLYAEYPPGSSEAAEELDAELLRERGEVFRREWFYRYSKANAQGMTVRLTDDGPEEFVPFVEVRLYADLAASLKDSADFTVMRAVGVSPVMGARPAVPATRDTPAQPAIAGRRYMGVLENVKARLEGPEQINQLERMGLTWRVSRAKLESVAYQLTAVQHLRARGTLHVDELKADRDKRARSIPGAAMMARREMFWPPDNQAPWMPGLIEEHVRFTGDPKKDEHDDDVDVTGYMAIDVVTVSRPRLT